MIWMESVCAPKYQFYSTHTTGYHINPNYPSFTCWQIGAHIHNSYTYRRWLLANHRYLCLVKIVLVTFTQREYSWASPTLSFSFWCVVNCDRIETVHARIPQCIIAYSRPNSEYEDRRSLEWLDRSLIAPLPRLFHFFGKPIGCIHPNKSEIFSIQQTNINICCGIKCTSSSTADPIKIIINK